MVVGTFPGAGLEGCGVRSTVVVEFLEPVAVYPVDMFFFDVLPTAPGGLREALLPRKLEGIIEANHGLGLHPPTRP